MFEIAVFSNPVGALVGEGGFLPSADFPRALKYDEDLVKPALLLADEVTLRSHRIDVVRGTVRDHNVLRFPVPFVSRTIGVSERRDADELALLGIRSSDLLTQDEAAELEAAFEYQGEGSEERWDRAAARAEPIVAALRTYYRSVGESLSSPRLAELAAKGFLREEPWDPLPKSHPQRLIDLEHGENTEFERAFVSMADDVASSTVSVMLDNTVHGQLTRFEGGNLSLGSTDTVRSAVDLMRMVNGLSELPLDEVADVRADLSPYIAPFRSFMIEVAGETDVHRVSDAERARLLRLAWEREVAPAVAELKGTLESASFRRNAIDVFASSGETLRTLGVAIGIAVASGIAGFSTLTAGVAVAQPLLRAMVNSVRAKEQAKRSRAYFVHAMSRR